MYVLCSLALALMNSCNQVPDSLRGMPGVNGSLAMENRAANRENLPRFTDRTFTSYKKSGFLVPLPSGQGLKIDPDLLPKLRFVRPETAHFLNDISADFYLQFKSSMQVSSASRTVEYQKKLRGINGNAAGYRPGLYQSTHLTGATVDVSKLYLKPVEIYWMRLKLEQLEETDHCILATEEFRRLTFHIMVLSHCYS
jgi:hypothetical protein